VRGLGAMVRRCVQDAPPHRLRRNTHAGLGFVSYDPRSHPRTPELSRKGPSAPELCSAASNLPVMRFLRGELPGTHRSGFVWERLHPARAACSYGRQI
jgi:hypothetical protein